MQIHDLNTFIGTPGETDYIPIDTGFDTAKISAKQLLAGSIPKPESEGTEGQLLRNKGNGSVEWSDYGLPTDEQTEEAINKWLDDHPEATTTVADHSLTNEKFVIGTLGYVMPEMFGAKGDGVTDDTAAIQAAMDACPYVLFTQEYLISTQSGAALTVNEGQTLQFVNGSTIRMAPNNLQNGSTFIASGVKNIKFFGNGNIIGDKITHTGSAGEYGHGISISNCENVEISGLNILLHWGDGVYIGSGTVEPCKNVFIHDCNISNNSRNNISVVAVDGCLISNVIVNGADRTAPKAGIDVEPNEDGTDIDYVRNCRIENIIALSNGEASIQVANFSINQSNHIIIDGLSANTPAKLISRVGSHLVELHSYNFKPDPSNGSATFRACLYVECNSDSKTIADGLLNTKVTGSVAHKTLLASAGDLYNFSGDFKVIGSSIVALLGYDLPNNYGNNSLIADIDTDYNPTYTPDQGGKQYFDTIDINPLNWFSVADNYQSPNMFGGKYIVPSDSNLVNFYGGNNSRVLPGARFIIINNKDSSIGALGQSIEPNTYIEIKCLAFNKLVTVHKYQL